jgi:uncharacterized protein YjbI with pentapeptide repeats
MANAGHLEIMAQGREAWEKWRAANPLIEPDLSAVHLYEADHSRANLGRTNLSEADLHGANLGKANLHTANLRAAHLYEANLGAADLREAHLYGANLRRANLSAADLRRAHLQGANLRGADLSGANLSEADLREADLNWAKLTGANLRGAILLETNLEGANLTGCAIYGISSWNAKLEGATQSDLVITRPSKPAIQVDDLEVAQFIYLLLNNVKIRRVIDTITSKVVLILGRFTPERRIVLDAIRNELRQRSFLPVWFDFERPTSRDLREIVPALARMARFVIADATDAQRIPQDLEHIAPDLPSVPIQPLLLASQHKHGMFEHLRRYPWILEPVLYERQEMLLAELESRVITPAEARVLEQTGG